MARRMRNPAKAEMAIAGQRDARRAAMANAVMVAEAAVMVGVASAAKVQPVKSAHPAKAVVAAKAVARVVKAVLKVVKAATNCVKAKSGPHAVNVMSGENVRSVLHAKAVEMVVAKTATKAETKPEAMPSLN